MNKFEQLGDHHKICVSSNHKFGTDAFLLAHFAQVRRNERCCDLGSGCGIIPMLWFRWDQSPVAAYAVELQEQGYEQMNITVAENQLEDLFFPIHSDLKNLRGKIEYFTMDLVTCNPPYKMAGHGVPCPDGTRLTARHEVDCTLEDVIAAADKLLRFGGRFSLCQRPERLPDIFEALRKAKLEPKRIQFVQQRPDKAPWLVLVEARKGGKPFLTVEAPLIIENEDGTFTHELLAIYRGDSV